MNYKNFQTLVNSIQWEKLEHAYGSARNAPEAFQDLLGNNQDSIEDAVYEFLMSSALHQYTTYSCTPYVVKCVLYIIEFEDIEDVLVISVPLIRELFCFIRGCTNSAQYLMELKKEIIVGKKTYKQYVNHNDKLTAKYAKELLNFSN